MNSFYWKERYTIYCQDYLDQSCIWMKLTKSDGLTYAMTCHPTTYNYITDYSPS